MAKGYARKAFREVLLQQREKMSLVELAKRLDRPVKTVSKWVSGEQSPARPSMLKACRDLGVDSGLLSVTDDRFHDLWRRQHLTFDVLQRRYRDLREARQTFESATVINLGGVLLLRELSQHGHPMRLTTTDLGDVQLVAAQADALLHNLYWQLSGNAEQGLVMSIGSLVTQNLRHSWLRLTSENVVLLLECCGKLQRHD